MAIKIIHVVCTNPESGMYLAYDREEPIDKAVGPSPEAAIGALVMHSANSPIQVCEISDRVTPA